MPGPIKLVEREAFGTAAKDGATDGLALRKAFSVDMKAFDLADRTIDFVISTATVDRAKDTIAVDGWDCSAFMKSPVVLWCHDSFQPPVGKALSVSKSKNALLSKAEFMSRELSPFADMVFRMYQERFLSAVSVGFIPITYSFSKDQGREFGVDFKTQELLEYSCCPVPANPEALIAARAAGIDTGPLREWASRVLDEGSSVLVPRNLLEETFRQAKTPRTVRQKYLAKSETSDWKVGAARDLTVDDKDAWDGAAAAKRVLDDAGFDGDSPDAGKAAKGFLVHDSANPMLRGSYKLPFADIVGGELKAIRGGITAAKGRLDQTDAPAAVLDEASAVIDHYEEKIGAADKSAPPLTIKAGRAVSAANAELLQKAMDHHASATECIKAVLDGNAPDEDGNDPEPDSDPDDDKPSVIVVTQPKALTEAEQRAQRVAEAKALRVSLNI